jgi:hypothetical protein
VEEQLLSISVHLCEALEWSGGFQTGAARDLTQLMSVGHQHPKLVEEHQCHGMEIVVLVSLWRRAALTTQRQVVEDWLLRLSTSHLLSRHLQRPSFPMAE